MKKLEQKPQRPTDRLQKLTRAELEAAVGGVTKTSLADLDAKDGKKHLEIDP